MTARAPNIILINCDDLGYGDLGCYGSTCNDTPHLDRLAAEGLRFTDFYMASSLCSPSRGAMMTGCYPPRIGFGHFSGGGVLFPGNPEGLHRDERTIADLLRARGYATALVGKWHCGDQPEHLPTRHGFDRYFGLPYSNDMGRQAGRQRQTPLPLLRDEEVAQQQPDQAALTERYVDACVDFIRDSKDQPFFLYFAHMHVHLPIYAPERFMRASRNGRYGAAVAAVDWSVGVLTHELERLGLTQDTLIVFTSDNGSRCRGEGGSNGPLRGTKATTWDGGLRVPCLARWPGRIPAGGTCPTLALAMDLLPTFVGLAGGTPPDDRIIDGRDLAGLLMPGQGATPPTDRCFFYYKGNDLDAVRDERWKLFVARNEHDPATGKQVRRAVSVLYDMRADIGETTDVAADHPDVVARLTASAAACRADLGDQAQGIAGANRRPVGLVADPRPLVTYDPAYPYFAAEYDLGDAG